MGRSILFLLAAGLLALPAASCGDGADAADFRVALLSPGPVSDEGWNAQAYEGLLRVESELGAEVRQVQVSRPAEFERALRSFAGEGFDVVFAHGFEFGEAARRVASDYPQTLFCVTSGDVTAPNVASIRFAIEEPARLAGLLAGSITATGRIGVVGGMEIPPVRSAFSAFEEGVHEANPDAEVLVSWIGSWEDVAAARQAAGALLDRGADVLFHDADAAGLGVLNAAEERGVAAIGCNRDQAPLKPDVVVASLVLDVAEAFLRVARTVRDQGVTAAGGKMWEFDLRSGVCDLVLNPRLRDRVSEVARRRIDAARRLLLAAGR